MLHPIAGRIRQRTGHRQIGRQHLPAGKDRNLKDRQIDKTGRLTAGFRFDLTVVTGLAGRTVGQASVLASVLVKMMRVLRRLRGMGHLRTRPVSQAVRARSWKDNPEQKNAGNENLKKVAHETPIQRLKSLYPDAGHATIELSVIDGNSNAQDPRPENNMPHPSLSRR